MNLILSEVEETISIVDVNDEGVAEGIRVRVYLFNTKNYCVG